MLQNWRFIIRCIDELGLILRNSIIWYKSNAMPSSVKDRFTNKYENVYMLVKNKKYHFDLDAVRIPIIQPQNINNASHNWEKRNTPNVMEWKKNAFNYCVRDFEKKSKQCPQFKATKEEIERYKKETGKIRGGGANLNLHYNPITGGRIYKKQTSIPQDQAESFGSPRARYWRENKWHPEKYGENDPRGARRGRIVPNGQVPIHPLGKNPGDVFTIPTQPCPRDFKGVHFAIFPEKLVEPMILAGCPKAGIVLDPFCGLGTTCVVAKRLGRNYIGIDLSPQYVKMAEERVKNQPTPLF